MNELYRIDKKNVPSTKPSYTLLSRTAAIKIQQFLHEVITCPIFTISLCMCSDNSHDNN